VDAAAARPGGGQAPHDPSPIRDEESMLEVEDLPPEPPEPPELGDETVASPPVTGDAAVDEAVAVLAEVSRLPLGDRPAVFEGVHRTLTDRLADVES
jgi:hypothetical protein